MVGEKSRVYVVHYRIGSLEIRLKLIPKVKQVHYRIGSLEKAV